MEALCFVIVQGCIGYKKAPTCTIMAVIVFCISTCGVLQEYVPFQPYVEGPLLVVLHISNVLPRYIQAAAFTNSGAGPAPLSAVFGGLSSADAQAAAQRVLEPASLGKLKRDLFYRWVVLQVMCPVHPACDTYAGFRGSDLSPKPYHTSFFLHHFSVCLSVCHLRRVLCC